MLAAVAVAVPVITQAMKLEFSHASGVALLAGCAALGLGGVLLALWPWRKLDLTEGRGSVIAGVGSVAVLGHGNHVSINQREQPTSYGSEIDAMLAAKRVSAQQAAIAALEPRRDVSLSEALAFAMFGEWGREFKDAATHAGDQLNVVLHDFHQKARDGDLHVWGKEHPHWTWGQIDKEVWATCWVEEVSLWLNKPHVERGQHQDGKPLFTEVMVNKREVEKAWPRRGD